MKTIALKMLDYALSLLLSSLWDIIKGAVALQERTDLTGAQKREYVFELAKREAYELGMELSESLIGLGIEAALQLLRAKTKTPSP